MEVVNNPDVEPEGWWCALACTAYCVSGCAAMCFITGGWGSYIASGIYGTAGALGLEAGIE